MTRITQTRTPKSATLWMFPAILAIPILAAACGEEKRPAATEPPAGTQPPQQRATHAAAESGNRQASTSPAGPEPTATAPPTPAESTASTALPAEQAPTPGPDGSASQDAPPTEDWTRQEAGDAFSLMLPPGWKVEPGRGRDSFIGAISGDGITPSFDYRRYSHQPRRPIYLEEEYAFLDEEIAGRNAKIVLSTGNAQPGREVTAVSSETSEPGTGSSCRPEN